MTDTKKIEDLTPEQIENTLADMFGICKEDVDSESEQPTPEEWREELQHQLDVYAGAAAAGHGYSLQDVLEFNGMSNAKKIEDPKWHCPDCNREIAWSYTDLAERGGPVCGQCDVDMILNEALESTATAIRKAKRNAIEHACDNCGKREYITESKAGRLCPNCAESKIDELFRALDQLTAWVEGIHDDPPTKYARSLIVNTTKGDTPQ